VAIDDPDHEVLPASRTGRRVRLLSGCLLTLIVVGFLVWYIASNATQRNDGRGWFGLVETDSADSSMAHSPARPDLVAFHDGSGSF
jgi:hypothetical protein